MLRVLPVTAIAAGLVSAPAWPQEAPGLQTVDAVVVTGSRIPRADHDRFQPTVVISSSSIESRGHTNLIDALNDIPAFGPPPSSKAGLQNSSFGIAQSYANFLSLDSPRTLTLINGHRFVSSNTGSMFGPVDPGQQVDLNSIPTKLIDRVEVVAVGGAPIYGSDAIAGTVNVILKHDFEGLDIDVLAGRSDRGDADSQRVRVLAGTNFGAGAGNLTLSAEYASADGLTYMDRPRTARGLAYAPPIDPQSAYVNELIEHRRTPILSTGGLPMVADLVPHFAGVENQDGAVMQFGQGGALVPFDFGAPTASLASASGGDGFNLDAVSNLQAATERANFTALASFQIAPSVRSYGEAWYSTTSGTRLVAQPLYNSLAFGPAGTDNGNLIMSTDNPFLSPESRAVIRENLLSAGADPSLFYLARANTDIQSGSARSESNLYRLVGGLEGEIGVGERRLRWEVSANYGKSKTSSREPQLVQQNFENALDAVTDPATGAIVCRGSLEGTLVSAPVRTGSSTCAPLNLFGNGSASKAARDYITAQASADSTITQRVFGADISGDVISLPGGDVRAVLGIESRRETSDFDPDSFYRGAWGRLVAIDPLRGEFETTEGFAELLIPVIGAQQRIPFLHELKIEGAARYIDHSVAGGDLTWTAGARLSPVADIQLRGNKTVAVRSPAITQAFLPTSNAFALADDPCDSRFITAGPDPATRAANCAAAGITQPFQSFIVDASAPISVSGNTGLRNEQADSRTWGVLLRPRWIPSLSLSVDWVEIDLADAIVTLNAETVLRACYDSSQGIDATPLCGNVDRDAAGQVTFVRTGYANAGSKRLKAIMAQLNYGAELGRFGRLDASLNFYGLRNLETRVGLGDVNQEAGEMGTSRKQGALTLGYRIEDFSMSLRTEYTGPARWDVDEPTDARDYAQVGEWWLFDLSAGYQFGERVLVRAFVDNLFDRDAPFPVPADGGTVAYFDGIFGRSYAVSLNYTF